VFIGVSVKDALKPEFLKKMNTNPIIFALANPDPEITYDLAKKTRSDCIMATGRSDYPNQVNNSLCFPYIFRGTLDVRAADINDEMKVAAAIAIAQLAWEEVDSYVLKALNKESLSFGYDYIVPSMFDPRLIVRVPLAVA